MKIGIDVDDVLADFQNTFLDYHNKNHGTSLKREDINCYRIEDIVGISIEEMVERIYAFCRTDSFRNMGTIAGSQKVIGSLNGKHELHVITSRSPIILNETVEWLNNHYPGRFVLPPHMTNQVSTTGKRMAKSEICLTNDIGLMIEDCGEYALDCAKKGIPSMLLDAPWNRDAPEHDLIKRVYSWEEIGRYL